MRNASSNGSSGHGLRTKGSRRLLLRMLCLVMASAFLLPSLLSCSSEKDDVIVLENKNDGNKNTTNDPAGSSDGNDDSDLPLADGHHYIVNISSKKMHLPDCPTALRIGAGNSEERFESYYDLLKEGYTPCSACLKTPPAREDTSDAPSGDVSSDPVSSETDSSSGKDAENDGLYKIDPSSKKLHTGDCPDAGADAVSTAESMDALVAKGYTPCPLCMGNASDGTSGEKTDDKDPAPQPEPEEVTYVLNTSSKKFHRPDCSSAAKIAEKNRSESHLSAEELEAQGYSPCKICNPA